MTSSVLTGLRRVFPVALLLTLSCALIPNASAQAQRKQFRAKTGAPFVSQAAAPQTSVWVYTAPMPTAREGLAAVGLNNKLYAIGGRNSAGNLNTVEVFLPTSNSWTTTAPMLTARHGLAAVALGNKIYAIGGSNGVSSLNTVEVYDPATNTWATGTPMLTPRAYLAAAVLGNKIYAVGGTNAGTDLNTVEVFNPSTNAWAAVAPTAIPRNGTAVVALNNKLYAIGGASSTSETYTNRMEVYDPASNMWTEGPPMLTERGYLGAAVLFNAIYAINGRGFGPFGAFGPLARVETYDLATNSWSQPSQGGSVFRQKLAACALDNKIYVLGGSNGGGFIDSMEVGALPPNPGDVLISEFRFSGASGAQDEFIELYNNTDAGIYIADSNTSNGWKLRTSNGALDITIQNGPFIPARGHYLIANSSGYSLGGQPNEQPGCVGGNCTLPNLNYAADIPETGVGLALFRNESDFNLENRLDAVGPAGETNTLYKEGNGVPAISGGAGNNYSFYRSLSSGRPADSNANESDFILVSTGSVPSGARLGAPAPENLNSPIQRTIPLSGSFIDPECTGFGTATSACARVRSAAGANPQNAAFGTLALRRRFTNKMGVNVTRLRFRIADITTTPETGVADLRAVGGTGSFNATLTNGVDVTIQRVTLEQPPTQTSGGGFNSTLSANTVTLGQPLVPGASINVEFILGVMTNGSFRFLVNVEALP